MPGWHSVKSQLHLCIYQQNRKTRIFTCHYWNDSLLCCMTEQAVKSQSMNVESSCLARKADICRTSHQVELLCYSTLNVQRTKVATAGIQLYSRSRICHALLTGAGSNQRALRLPGNHYGPLCPMLQTAALSC